MVWNPRCFWLDLAKAGHSSRKCWDNFISSSFKQQMELAFGKMFNLIAWFPIGQCPVKTFRTLESWTLVNTKSFLDLLRITLDHKDPATVQLLVLGQRLLSWFDAWQLSRIIHKLSTDPLPVPIPQLMRLKYRSMQVHQPYSFLQYPSSLARYPNQSNYKMTRW